MNNVNDELKIYRGKEFIVCDNLTIQQPTLGEICDFGEEGYFSGVTKLVATPNEMIYPLTEMGIDFTTISEFQLFVLISTSMEKDVTQLLMPNMDFSTGKIFSQHKISATGKEMKAEEIVLKFDNGVVLNEKDYTVMTDYIRKINHIQRTWWRTVGSESTKKRLIRNAKSQYLEHKNFPKPFKSLLLPLVSSLVNSPDSKADWNTVWDMRLGVFFDSIERIQLHENAVHLYTGIYSGCVDFDKVKTQLNWMERLN